MVHLDETEIDSLWDDDDLPGTEQRLRDAAEQADGAMADELRTQVARVMGLQGEFAQALTLLDGISTGDAVVQQRIALERGRVLNTSGEVSAAMSQLQEAYRLDADPVLTLEAIRLLEGVDIAHADMWRERWQEHS